MRRAIQGDILTAWVNEDITHLDLTTHLLEIGDQPARAAFYARDSGITCGTEEAVNICEKEGVQVISFLHSGDPIEAHTPFFVMEGRFDALNAIVKVLQNIFEYAGGIASRTDQMVRRAKVVSPKINVLTTRKVFPGTKALSIKAILSGGAYPHRLGLSETILLFKQHIDFVGGFEGLKTAIPKIHEKDCEKPILVEVTNEADALSVAELPIYGIQYDKLPPEILTEIIEKVRAINPKLVHLAAGGINLNNVEIYANTGADGLVTTSLYFGKPLDVGVKFTPVTA